jgi:hypothetical protein
MAVHTMSRFYTDQELVELRARAERVLASHSSGSARALAKDMLRMTHIMQTQRLRRNRVRAVQAEKARIDVMLAELESQWEES